MNTKDGQLVTKGYLPKVMRARSYETGLCYNHLQRSTKRSGISASGKLHSGFGIADRPIVQRLSSIIIQYTA
jgi:hypothetical protein